MELLSVFVGFCPKTSYVFYIDGICKVTYGDKLPDRKLKLDLKDLTKNGSYKKIYRTVRDDLILV